MKCYQVRGKASAIPEPAGQAGKARWRCDNGSCALAMSDPEMLTVSGAAAFSGITEKTIRKALKDGRLAYTVDTSSRTARLARITPPAIRQLTSQCCP